KEGVPEDEIKQLEKDVQTLTDKFSAKIDKLFELKEKDIMTV
ncbi:MAG TPA: ribosome recycling factor, partial [Bacteroidales bacterium]|nr:ribosome recycling factor [Bacteroidales bacterium]